MTTQERGYPRQVIAKYHDACWPYGMNPARGNAHPDHPNDAICWNPDAWAGSWTCDGCGKPIAKN